MRCGKTSAATPNNVVKENVLPTPKSLSSQNRAPTHQLGELLANSKAQAGTPILAGHRGVCLVEGLKQLRHLWRRQADARCRR